MIEKWMISTYTESLISKQSFVRETEFFYVDSHKRRRAKTSRYEVYFDTWEEARARLIEIAVARMENASLALKNATKLLNEVNALEKPE